ncbi:hypothetical protein BCR43DRAFT_276055 [Syncephalastrum racemosum]|uniref:Uncharacterized protein n=1 Tax=Syncephalastrum racemosum TaxID=13706 RepID=A0A1X2HCB6_SYNRA|nr:hypothetical protein BCR43DRAFT_276055 [Syncephalastrum racemosum]
MTTPANNKRSLSSEPSTPSPHTKRARADEVAPISENNQLLSELTSVLAEIRSTPSTGEISAELLETFKLVMLQIERLSSDETNEEARQMRHESDLCLESWFDDLLAQCQADGGLDLEALEAELVGLEDEEEDDDDVEALSLALALQKEEEDEHNHDEEDEEVVIVDDDEEDQSVKAEGSVEVVA